MVRVRFDHFGIPTTGSFEGEIDVPRLKITVSDHQNNPFGIQWQRYWDDAPYPELVKTVPHVAFEVDDLMAAIAEHNVIIEPNSPGPGARVAFVEVNGAPVELMPSNAKSRLSTSVARWNSPGTGLVSLPQSSAVPADLPVVTD